MKHVCVGGGGVGMRRRVSKATVSNGAFCGDGNVQHLHFPIRTQLATRGH